MKSHYVSVVIVMGSVNVKKLSNYINLLQLVLNVVVKNGLSTLMALSRIMKTLQPMNAMLVDIKSSFEN